MRLIIDTNILGKLCLPKSPKNQAVAQWFRKALSNDDYEFHLPEISDYELRRKLIHLVMTKQAEQTSIERLDQLGKQLDYIPLNTSTLRVAADLWAQARKSGQST